VELTVALTERPSEVFSPMTMMVLLFPDCIECF
jgi:hypothetical protein